MNSPKPRLLDLFCGAGGAAVGYSRAGFDVVGVDHVNQPRYPFEFVQADALEWLKFAMTDEVLGAPAELRQFDAIHASPPCQRWTTYRRTNRVNEHPDFIADLRVLLYEKGLPYVIENVVGSPLVMATLICGTMLDPPMEIQRHRLFETNWLLDPMDWWPCRHKLNGPDRYPGGRSKSRTGSSRGLVRATVEIGSWDIPLDVQQRAMGIDWMTLDELSEAIPPAYTELIGHQLMQHLKASSPSSMPSAHGSHKEPKCTRTGQQS